MGLKSRGVSKRSRLNFVQYGIYIIDYLCELFSDSAATSAFGGEVRVAIGSSSRLHSADLLLTLLVETTLHRQSRVRLGIFQRHLCKINRNFLSNTDYNYG